jgi:hypothetical protein
LGYFNFKVIFNISSVSVDLNALYTKKIILDLRPATSNIFPTRCFPGAARNPNQRYTWEKAITAGLSSGDPTVITNLINKNTSNYITSGMMIEVKATWSPSLNVIWLDLAMYYYTLQSTD